jgi:hypothetical protein
LAILGPHGAPALLWSKVALTIFNGEYAVILFFIISGSVLQLSLNRFLPLSASRAARGNNDPQV